MRVIRYCWQSVNQQLKIVFASRQIDATQNNGDTAHVDRCYDDVVLLPEFTPYISLSEHASNRAIALDHKSLQNSWLQKNPGFRQKVVAAKPFIKKHTLFVLLTLVMLSYSLCVNAATGGEEFGSAIDYTMYKLAVERNDASAQYLVGRNFLKGKTVTKNIKEAIKWFKRAAEQDHQLAQYELGRIYFYGDGVKRNTALGLDYVKKAADNGLDEAQLFLGIYYLGNLHVNSRGQNHGHNNGKPNIAEAKKWLLSAAEYNNPRAQYQYGKLLIESDNEKDKREGEKWLRNAADAGLVEASKVLRQFNIHHTPVHNTSTAISSSQQTNGHIANSNSEQTHSATSAPNPVDARTGNANAAQLAASTPVQGNNQSVSTAGKGKPEVAKAKVDSSITLRAANRHSSPNSFIVHAKLSETEKKLSPGKQFNLAMDYINGEHGAKKDLGRGISLLLSAAHRDNPRAQYTYGLMLRDGAGVEQDTDAAISWLEKAAKAGLASAQREYDNLKLHAVLSSSDNNPDKPAAQFSLGLRLLKGDGIRRDEARAAKWILKAAKQNHHEAEARIGSMYRQGIGVEKNNRQAQRWLEKAANAGVLSAARELKAMQENEFKPSARANANDSSQAAVQKTSLSLSELHKGGVEQDIAINSTADKSSADKSTKTNSASSAQASPSKSKADKLANKESKKQTGKSATQEKSSEKNSASQQFAKLNAAAVPDLTQMKSVDSALAEKAKNGDSDAQYQIGEQLLKGAQTSEAMDQGIKWLTLAANNHHLPAALQLGEFYQSGEHVERDLKKAYNWYLLAASAGDDSAQLILGDMYRNGEGISADNSEAIRWYRKAANQGNEEARHRLGGCKIC